jgi:hypothetical protein
MRFLVDDGRSYLPDGSIPDVIIRFPKAALSLIVIGWLRNEDELYLDHDMGDKEYDGHFIASEMEKMWRQDPMWAQLHIPSKIVCVSDNPQGRLRIEQAIANITKMRDKWEATHA